MICDGDRKAFSDAAAGKTYSLGQQALGVKGAERAKFKGGELGRKDLVNSANLSPEPSLHDCVAGADLKKSGGPGTRKIPECAVDVATVHMVILTEE